jgi:hypothetical protein
MTTRHSYQAASWGAVLLTVILVACANGSVDDSSGDPVVGDDSGVSLDDSGNVTQDDSGTIGTFDSGGNPQDSGNPPQDSGNPPQDSGNPPQDSGNPPQDSGNPPQDSGNPPPDSGPVCNAPSGNPCLLEAPQCGCAANQKCDVNPNSATKDLCVNTTSSGGQGATCNQYPDCSAGFACICTSSDPIFGCLATECEAWCVIGGPNICTGGTTCKALGATINLGGKNYGTCQ